MLNLKKILVPVDFSETSAHAARYAAHLAQRFESEVTLLNVLPPFQFEFAMAQPASQRYLELIAERNQAVRQALESFPKGSWNGLPVCREIAEGDAADQIIRRAEEGRHDAIVIPTRGASAFRRWLMIGSVTAKVLSGAECPVLTGVHFDRHSPLDLNHILCAVDLGPQSAKVLSWSGGMAARFNAGLTVVHAGPSTGEAAADYFDESWRMTLKTRLNEKMAALLDQAGLQAQAVVEFGSPPKVVSDAARKVDADLVILGRGVSNDLIGRLRADAYEIIRQSPCPAMSV